MFKKRIVAGFIDFLISAIIQAVLLFTFIIRPLLSQKIAGKQIILQTLLITFISMSYMMIRDLFGNRSIGKKIIKLKIININTQNDSGFLSRFLRNITWLFGPIEIVVFLILQKRIGDIIAKTKVTNFP